MIYSATFYRAMRLFRVQNSNGILAVLIVILFDSIIVANGNRKVKLLIYKHL